MNRRLREAAVEKLAMGIESPYSRRVVARILAKSLRRLSQSLGTSLHHLAESVDRRLRRFAERVDRRMGREHHADGRPSASLFESLRRLVEQVYKNLHRKKRRDLKEIIDVCVLALEAPVTNDVHMAELLRTQRTNKTVNHTTPYRLSEGKRTRIQLPPRKLHEDPPPSGSQRLKKKPIAED